MSRLYASPMRVYLALLLVACFGIWMGMGLPVALFPNSSKPKVHVGLSYGGIGAEDFKTTYGDPIEARVRSLSDRHLKVEKVEADYSDSGVSYLVEFEWGCDPQEALKETDHLVRAAVGSYPKEIRDSLSIFTSSKNTGFFAASFYSESRSLDEVYRDLQPRLGPRLSQVQDAKEAILWNPDHKKIVVELDPARLASLQISPSTIERSIQERTSGYSAGSITIGTQNLPVQVQKPNTTVDDLSILRIDAPNGKSLYLGDIAHIDYRAEIDSGEVMKTSGAPSLILWAAPRPGGNVKKMSEDILKIVDELKPQFPKDIQYKVLVDPSEFIRGAIENVFHEVLIGSLLAVGILFLFIGSLKNVITAAIEIPLSMVLAFILMRMTGMNLNLISLGGLALASGMNVDASVVVMENIFRHLEQEEAPTDFNGKLQLILNAVREVRLAVIASTIASLVVFAPLAFTSALSYAVLGDLAKTVIFSHGFSAVVALILVPTVRLHLLSKAKNVKKEVGRSPIEGQIQKLEKLYSRSLEKFIASRKIQLISVGLSALLLVGLLGFALPKLPKEVLGKPDTDWIMLGMDMQGGMRLKQMENRTEELEMRLLRQFGSEIQYTFTQVNSPNSSMIMMRLKDKRKMKEIWKGLEEQFKNEATLRYWAAPWNPAELPLPNPPDLKVVVEGGHPDERREAASSIRDALEDHKVLPRIWTEPNSEKSKAVVLRPYPQLQNQVSPGELSNLIRVATQGKNIHSMKVDQTFTEISLQFPKNLLTSSEDLQSFPVGVEGKIVPLRALAEVNIEDVPASLHSENGRELFQVVGRKQDSAEKTSDQKYLKEAQTILNQWKSAHVLPNGVTVNLEDAQVEINDAIRQLSIAIGLSIVMIFFTLLFQMGSMTQSLIVLAAIPFGFIGVLTSLFLFRSTLSLNSVLGVILLNGIAVGNSIILVDFTQTLFEHGVRAKDAILEGAQKRLRPILITSLTTILGMLPVALGLGQGGRVLQPLGIAVSGGLWVSMSLTLFMVPALQYHVLRNREKAKQKTRLQDLFLTEEEKEDGVLISKLPSPFPAPEVSQ